MIFLLVAGCTNDEIGARLAISTKTVEFHLGNMYDRYALSGRVSLVVLSLSARWCDSRLT